MRYIILYSILLVSLFSCKEQNKNIDAVARVYNSFLYEEDIVKVSSDNLSNRGFSEMFKNMFVLAQTINYKKADSIKFLIEFA